MTTSFRKLVLLGTLALGLTALLPGEAWARGEPRGERGRGGGHGGPYAGRHGGGPSGRATPAHYRSGRGGPPGRSMPAHYRPGRGPGRGPGRPAPAYRSGHGPRRAWGPGQVVGYRGAPRWHVWAPPPPPAYYAPPRVRVWVSTPPVVVVPTPPVVVRPAPPVYRYEQAPAEPEPEEHFHEHFYDQPAPQGEGWEDEADEYDDAEDGYDTWPGLDGAPQETPDDGWEAPAPEPQWGPRPGNTPATPAAPTAAPDVLTSTEIRRIEGEILALVNAERARRGIPALAPEARLARAAAQHSGEMYRLDYFAHESPVAGNKSFTDRMTNAGLKDFGSAAENIVMANHGADVARRLVQLWLDSPGHLENILRPEFRLTGVGVFGDGERVYATQLFASDAQ